MSGRFFLDTNVLVYSFDSSSPQKRSRSHDLIAEALEGEGLISYQVVQEFLNVALRKFSAPMSTDQAQTYLEGVLLPLCQVHSDPDLFSEALGIQLRWRFSFYDALVVAAAQRAGCARLYTEDLQHGQQLGELTVLDPFR